VKLPAADAGFELQPASAADFEPMLALRLRAMHDSLSRIGRYDEPRVRERLAAGFDPAHTWHIAVEGRRVGFMVLKTLSHALRLDHLYIDPAEQRRGIGTRVLRWICDQADVMQQPVELCVLKGSDAGRFYLRQGFVHVADGEWDLDFVRATTTPAMRTVQAMWAAFQARDWPAARALLRDDLQVRWWTSGERFGGADGFVEAQARYPEGWTIHLVELARLHDGRVLALLRVDQPPHSYFATSIARVDDDRVAGIDEYWATAEPPPDWRVAQALQGWSRFEPLDDPRSRRP
jgi:GNAT superfamily N-acetyltransferase